MGRAEWHAWHRRRELRNARRGRPHLTGEIAPGAIPSPNIWKYPDVYELENRFVDPDGVIEATMRAERSFTGAAVLDIGCGAGFHLPRFAAEARSVIGVEPHPALVARAQARIRGTANVDVRQGSAHAIPVADASIDIAQARWAYFFGPGCEPGLRELARVMKASGVAFVIDNDATTSTFGRWFARALPSYDARGIDAFFSQHGWQTERKLMRWEFERRADFEAVIRIEFSPEQAALILAEHAGATVDYAIVIRHRTF